MTKEIDKAASDPMAAATDFALETGKQIKDAIISVSPDALGLTLGYIQVSAIIDLAFGAVAVAAIIWICRKLSPYLKNHKDYLKNHGDFIDNDPLYFVGGIVFAMALIFVITSLIFTSIHYINRNTILAAISPELWLTGKVLERIMK